MVKREGLMSLSFSINTIMIQLVNTDDPSTENYKAGTRTKDI
jgi:hypothetical protein